MQGAIAYDPERFVRLYEAAFNLAARIGDFTVVRNLFADRGTITRQEPGQSEMQQDIDYATALVPRAAVFLFRDVAGNGRSVSARYVGSGWPGSVRGHATFTLDDDGRVVDLRLEEHAPVVAESWQARAVPV